MSRDELKGESTDLKGRANVGAGAITDDERLRQHGVGGSGTRAMSLRSWILTVLGLVAAFVAVQFDDPWLEITGAVGFVLLFGWLVVAMRSGGHQVR